MKKLSLVFCVVACVGLALTGALYYSLLTQHAEINSELSALQKEYFEKESTYQREINHLKNSLAVAGSKSSTLMARNDVNAKVSSEIQNAPCANMAKNSADTFVDDIESFHISEAVLNKYKTLLDIVEVGSLEEQALLELLAQRERILNMVSHSYFTNPLDSELALQQREEKLSELDDQVASVLEPSQFDNYQLLKDSGFEQHQVQEFEGQLSADELLTEGQANNLLLAKLRFKEDYLYSIKEASKMVNDGDREKGFNLFESAIERYRTRYLDVARGELNSVQFKMLNDYEKARFSSMLFSLKAAYEDYAID